MLFECDERVDFYVFRDFFCFFPGGPRLDPLRVEHGPNTVQPEENYFGRAARRRLCPTDGVSDDLDALARNRSFETRIQHLCLKYRNKFK